MTIEEAIKTIEIAQVKVDECNHPIEYRLAFEEAFKALLRQLCEKPNKHKGKGSETILYFCPTCGYGVGQWMNNCSQCGQRLDWSDTK